MNKYTLIIASLIVMISLSACSNNSRNIKELDMAEAIGSPYNVALKREYNKLSMLFNNDYLARKGLAANEGIFVQPETIEHFRYKSNNRDILEKTEARARLMHLLQSDGRTKAPYETAVAQSRFDCWILNEKYREPDMFSMPKFKKSRKASKPFSCKQQFVDVINLAERKVNNYDHHIDAPEVPEPYMFPSISSIARKLHGKGIMANVDDAMFLTFFDWDKDTLSKSAHDILDAVAAEINARDDVTKVVLVGHADTSGDEHYNKNLSIRRAINVSYALVDRGIDHKMIKAEGRGETELLVETNDNVREPSNRRVAISFE